MPEGPELHIAARFINATAKKHKFGGAIEKSEVSTKNPTVEWSAKEYNIVAKTRGKELKIFLAATGKPSNKTHLLFRFGMSGCFKFAEVSELPKHAHLRFYTIGTKPAMALCFVDYRRFGRWEIEGDWGSDRGPDPIYEYDEFRSNVLDNLDNAAFNRPICEAMLNQKYFNGIGNYLRAEILFRCGVKPFDQARAVLQVIKDGVVKAEDADLLQMCNIVPKEVLALDSGKSYDPNDSQKSQETFSDWLQCYYVEGMNNLEDGNGRTMWFAGSPGSMAPKVKKVKGRKGKKGTQIPQSGTEKSSEEDSKVKVKQPKSETGGKSNKPKTEKKAQPKTEIKEEPNENGNAPRKGKVKVEVKEEKTTVKRTKSDEDDRPRQSKARRASTDVDFKKFF